MDQVPSMKWWNAIPGWVQSALAIILLFILALNLIIATLVAWSGFPCK